MIIDTDDSLFAISDSPDTDRIDCSILSDEDLLFELNWIPRDIGGMADYLQRIQEECRVRELFEPAPEIELAERTDDWLAERRAAIRLEITKLTKQQEALAAEREEIEQEFFNRFTERNTSGTRTSNYTISAKQDDHYPEVEDRTEFEQYLLKTGKIHLLQKRLSLTSIREELDIMKEQKEAYLNDLEAASWDIETCRYVLVSLADSYDEPINEQVIENKLATLQATNTVKEGMKDTLNQHYSIPGIGISTKLTLNQVKRG